MAIFTGKDCGVVVLVCVTPGPCPDLDLDLDLHLTNYSQKICMGAESSQIYPDMDLDIDLDLDLDRKFVFVFICNYLVAEVISIFSESTEISGFCLSWG